VVEFWGCAAQARLEHSALIISGAGRGADELAATSAALSRGAPMYYLTRPGANYE